ncbi:MAG: hypothetical protein V4489_04705 [Chlamydiota bacterium]
MKPIILKVLDSIPNTEKEQFFQEKYKESIATLAMHPLLLQGSKKEIFNILQAIISMPPHDKAELNKLFKTHFQILNRLRLPFPPYHDIRLALAILPPNKKEEFCKKVDECTAEYCLTADMSSDNWRKGYLALISKTLRETLENQFS